MVFKSEMPVLMPQTRTPRVRKESSKGFTALLPLPWGSCTGEGTGASGEGQSQLGANPCENGIDVAADLLVREPHAAHAEALQHFRRTGVMIRKPFMLLAVDFDDEFGACSTYFSK